MHFGDECHRLLNFIVLAEQAVVKKESLFEVRAQKQGLVEALLGFSVLLVATEVVKGETVESISVCLVSLQREEPLGQASFPIAATPCTQVAALKEENSPLHQQGLCILV